MRIWTWEQKEEGSRRRKEVSYQIVVWSDIYTYILKSTSSTKLVKVTLTRKNASFNNKLEKLLRFSFTESKYIC